MKIGSKFLLLLMLSPKAVAASDVGDMAVVIDGISPGKGEVVLELFLDAAGFPDGSPKRTLTRRVPASAPKVEVAFENLPPGRYAIALYQDANENQRLDTHLFGYPTERFGFSRNPKVLLGPPSHSEVEFEWSPDQQAVHILLKRWGD